MIDDAVLHNIFTLVSFGVSFEKFIYSRKYSSFQRECFQLLKQTISLQVRGARREIEILALSWEILAVRSTTNSEC